jgi:hypothetical protein
MGFDRISKLFAPASQAHPETRASLAQGATPEAALEPTEKVEFLFVQTYQSGTIAPVEGRDGRYALTLEAGTGSTVYFSDRPERVAGIAPTPQFLHGLGFLDDNPPNAALVFEAEPGNTDVAVVELFNPGYDPETQNVTYEVEVLNNWQNELELGLQEAPTDLAAIAPSFGAARLFIDDCADADMQCVNYYTGEVTGIIANSDHDGFCYSWSAWWCLPCDPWIPNTESARKYWLNWCNNTYPTCNHFCVVKGFW